MKKDRYIDEKRQIYRRKKTDISTKKDRHTTMEADVCLFNLLTIKDYFFLSTA